MSNTHSGNMLNEINREEHDGANYAKRVNVVAGGVGLATITLVSTPTLFAVVNTAAAGQASVVLDTGVKFIGIVTVANPSSFAGNVTLDDGSLTGIVGNVTLSDSKGFIGLTTTTLGASPAFIGLVTVTNKDRTLTGNVTLSDSKTYIGLVTATLSSMATVTLGTALNSSVDSVAIGGTTKTLIPKTIAFAQASIVTIAVPTNTFNITHLVINSNATTRLNIKSGASYLTGNVTLGMNIFPGGGWVQDGSVDSPVYIGLSTQSAIVIEKFDTGGIISQIGGHLTYFDA